ncbi:Gti1/Pac2 family protein [Purpureocillium lavendulum]|uniref:Gti1/Pac2 family protein n=1 Tax=Purpureocillium lavendulum TaxID=1247861 RepID=A0AB34FQY4_9HYPO|nr:Gti1/Pac2 family protein [Purpureocillium lavendulum]
MSHHSTPLIPTWRGHIASTLDALLLFEAALSGRLNHVPRRPHDRERQELIKSGSVFIYEEHASGIKRWTDGVSWSPSRILGNFLIYRELDKPFPPGEKKRAIRRKRATGGSSSGVTKSEGTSRSSNGGFLPQTSDNSKDIERSLIGSLVDSYPFKENGLVKKTISITYHGIPHHLVSYYGVDDVLSGGLLTPSRDTGLRDIVPRVELMTSQNFRAPVDEIEYNPDGTPTLLSVHGTMGEYGSGSILQRAWTGGLQTMPAPAYTGPQAASFPFSHGQQSPYGGQLTHALSHPMPSSMPPPLHSSMSLPVPASIPPPSPAGMPFAPHSQGNYALDPNRAERLGAPGSGIGSEFPRNMPTQSAPRRHSAFDGAGSAADLAGLPLGPMGEARTVVGGGSAYLQQPQSQYLLGGHRPNSMPSHDNQLYPSPREVKVESNAMGADDGGTHQYALDETSGPWSFDAMDGPPDQQYYGGQ